MLQMLEVNRLKDPRVQLAREFARTRHELSAPRKGDGRPFFTHPDEISQLLWGIGITDPLVHCGVYLHDMVDHQLATYADIVNIFPADQRYFGKRTATLVRELTDPNGMEFEEKKKYQTDRARHMLIRAQFMRAGDVIHNSATTFNLDPCAAAHTQEKAASIMQAILDCLDEHHQKWKALPGRDDRRVHEQDTQDRINFNIGVLSKIFDMIVDGTNSDLVDDEMMGRPFEDGISRMIARGIQAHLADTAHPHRRPPAAGTPVAVCATC